MHSYAYTYKDIYTIIYVYIYICVCTDRLAMIEVHIIDANGGRFKALEPAPRQQSLLRSLIGVWHLSCRWEVRCYGGRCAMPIVYMLIYACI